MPPRMQHGRVFVPTAAARGWGFVYHHKAPAASALRTQRVWQRTDRLTGRDISVSVRRSSPLGRHPACRERARFNRGGERRRSASPAYGQALPRGPRPVALTIPGSRCGCVRRTLSLWVFSTLGDEVCLNVDASAPSLGGLPEVTYRVPGQLIRTSWICCGQPAYTYLEALGFGARRALNFVIAWTQTPL